MNLLLLILVSVATITQRPTAVNGWPELTHNIRIVMMQAELFNNEKAAKVKTGRKPINLAGQVFGKLTIIEQVDDPRKGAHWRCLCECGNTTVTAGCRIVSGKTTSCGCWKRNCQRTHGMGKTSTYLSWQEMKRRVTDPNKESYKYYGARGITICDRWKESFENFLSDMGPRPEGTTLDRKEVNGNYEPDNCKWSTQKEQCNNRRDNRHITWNGETLNLAQWAERTGIGEGIIRDRIDIWNWPVEKALTKPIRVVNRMITFQGKTQLIGKWAEELGTKYNILYPKVLSGEWPPKEAA